VAYFTSFVIFTAASAIMSLLSHSFIATRQAGYVLGQGVIFSLLKLALVAILSVFFSSFGIFSAWGLATAVAIAIGSFIFLRRIQGSCRPVPAIKGNLLNMIFRFSFTNYLSALLWDAPTFILPLIVVNILSPEQNAYFYVALALGGLLKAIPMSASLSLFAEGSYRREDLKNNIHRSLKIILVLLLPAIGVILLLGDKLLLLFGQPYSQHGTRLLWLLAIAALPTSLNFIYISVKRVEKNLAGVLLITAFVAITTIALSYVLLPGMGLPGAGVALLTAQGTAAMVVLANWIRKRRIFT
jgi:O-antigen/teichoic acid export membrane protein